MAGHGSGDLSGPAPCPVRQTGKTPLLAIEQRADAMRVEARRCFALGWHRRTAALVGEVIRIEALPEDFKLLTSACLLCGDFQTTCRAYTRFRSRY